MFSGGGLKNLVTIIITVKLKIIPGKLTIANSLLLEWD